MTHYFSAHRITIPRAGLLFRAPDFPGAGKFVMIVIKIFRAQNHFFASTFDYSCSRLIFRAHNYFSALVINFPRSRLLFRAPSYFSARRLTFPRAELLGVLFRAPDYFAARRNIFLRAAKFL